MIEKISRTIVAETPKVDFLSDFKEGIKIQYNTPREDGVHISDLIPCPRRASFIRIEGKGEINDDSAINFFSGEIVDDKVKNAVSLIKERLNGLGSEYEVKHKFEINGIIGRPDVVHRADNVVIEVKSTRKDDVIDEPDYHYKKQLMYYMAHLNSPYGILFYVILSRKDKKAPLEKQKRLVQHYVFFKDAREKLETDNEMKKSYEGLKNAVEKGDPGLAPHIATDLNYAKKDKDGKRIPGTNWMCNFCEFKKKCDVIRARDGEFAQKEENAMFSRLKSIGMVSEPEKNDEMSRQMKTLHVPDSWK